MFSRHQSLLCVLVLGLCVGLSWPFAETGMHDDGYYILIVREFARTGHIVFNGWGAPMLGVMLFPAAFLVKLFGFSFSLVRFTTVAAALITTALLQRTFVRCGLRNLNASLATTTLMTSPVVLPLVTSFLTDIWSLLAIVLCLYCCLRSLRASEHASAFWICAAALGNAVLGSARQIAWLGVLVMVPCTVWLLRRHANVVRAGIGAVMVSVAFILCCLTWLAHKAYTLPEGFSLRGLRHAAYHPSILGRPLLEIPMLVLPVLLMFLPAVTRRGKGRLVALTALAVACACGWHEYRLHALHNWYVPFLLEPGSVFGPKGVYHDWPAWGSRPGALPTWLRAALAGVTLVGGIAWLAEVMAGSPVPPSPSEPQAVARHDLAVVTIPFTAAYAFFLLPRALRSLTIDRYLVPLVMIALLWLVLCFQNRVRRELPRTSLALCLLIGVYSAATLQDAFAIYRTVVRAGNELAANGIPRTEFDGGGEYDGITQVEAGGYVHQSGIRMPPGQQLLFGHRRTGPCEIPFDVWIPDVNPVYALAYTPDGCGGPTPYRPLTYRRLLWPHTVTLYLVKDPDCSGKHGLFSSFD